MNTVKKTIVEAPKSADSPVKAQTQPEHKTQPEAAKPGGNQPKPKA